MSALTLSAITELGAALRASGIVEMELTLPDGERLCLRAGSIHAVPPPPATMPPELMVRATGPGVLAFPDPIVPEGTRVVAGQIVAFARAGALLRPIIAPADGYLGRCVKSEGDLLGYDTPVFAFRLD